MRKITISVDGNQPKVKGVVQMRRIVVVAIVVALACLSIVGCSSSGNSASASASNSSGSSSTATLQSESANEGTASEPASQEPAGNTVEVPDFTNRYAATAAEQALELGLTPILKSDNGKVVVNPLNWRVVDQDPFPGEVVGKGSAIIIKVTKDDSGKDTSGASESVAIVPSVVGMNAADAEKQLEGVGLKADIKSDDGKKVLKKKNWTVASQSPEEGTVMAKGSKVTLTVSKNK